MTVADKADLQANGRWLCECSRCGFIAPADYPWVIKGFKRYCDRFCAECRSNGPRRPK